MIITRRVRVQLTVFLVIALSAVTLIGVRYVGLGRLVGAGGYTVTVDMPETGGIFTNAEVTYRGVPVGRVGPMRLTDDGVEIDLQIRNSAPDIASNGLKAVVANRSVIGEQYLDLQPTGESGPFLTEGSLIRSDQTTRPPSSEQLLQGIDSLVSSVPVSSLQTVVSELGTSFNGTAGQLQKLLDSTSSFITTADQNFPATVTLLTTSSTVLATQRATSQSITDFSQNLADIAATLKNSDGDLRRLVQAAPLAAGQLTQFVDSVGPGLGTVIANLISPAQVFSANVAGVQGVLVQLPQAISVGNRVFSADGLRVGLATTFFDPLPCTQGYEGTVRRGGLDTSPGAPFNTAAGCTAAPGSGQDVRGSNAAPGAGG